MTVYMEQVIAYWSRSLKSAERNYSATEREALGVKEALVRFQPFIEGEKNIVITDHAALQWARTYENANRRLTAWGAVFAAYPGLDIVHRAGIVHSNVDPLSRLPQIPLHQSPVEDKSPALPSPLTAQPIFAWEDVVERKPAE
jgi:RNase H-like domain found in reverse transcriptase